MAHTLLGLDEGRLASEEHKCTRCPNGRVNGMRMWVGVHQKRAVKTFCTSVLSKMTWSECKLRKERRIAAQKDLRFGRGEYAGESFAAYRAKGKEARTRRAGYTALHLKPMWDREDGTHMRIPFTRPSVRK